MEITLIASYNPEYKYLRVRSASVGYSPNMVKNGTYDKGYFQSKINFNMYPYNDKITTFSTSPQNVNKATQYTTGSQFNVGVDISKNPGFSSSYTVSQSQTLTITDFNIYNNGSGRTVNWDFVMSMTKDSVWDTFKHPIMKKGQVKPLPALASRNLQPGTETVWYVSNTLNATVRVQFDWTADYLHCWVTGNKEIKNKIIKTKHFKHTHMIHII